jgi:hypothetical protein
MFRGTKIKVPLIRLEFRAQRKSPCPLVQFLREPIAAYAEGPTVSMQQRCICPLAGHFLWLTNAAASDL